MEIDIDVLPTPNPNALKFVINQKVKETGKSTYRSPAECPHNLLALKIFELRGVDQLHFYSNVITVSKFNYQEWGELEGEVVECLKKHLPTHDPNYKEYNPEEERRAALPPELQEIEEILDRTIRPNLQADGGDIECLEFKDDVLIIKYQGACGTCPSSTTGTLFAIKNILYDELKRPIEVYPVPE